MRITLVTPVPPQSRQGNRITAVRMATLLRQLGHQVRIEQEWTGGDCALLIALHARKSHGSVARMARLQPGKPIVVVLTGTDVYDDIHHDPQAQATLENATRLVVLQPLAIGQLPPRFRPKASVVYQSCEPPSKRLSRRKGVFEVCVVGHLRPVKDPFRTAQAVRLLPSESRLRVLHLGAALTPDMEKRARQEMRLNPRYCWLGDVLRGRTLQLMSRCRLLVLTSHLEGGANAISEAIVAGTPVLSSQIDGSVGLLGEHYPGYFTVGDTAALTDLLTRAETDARFYRELSTWCRSLRPRFSPARERAAWRKLLRALILT